MSHSYVPYTLSVRRIFSPSEDEIKRIVEVLETAFESPDDVLSGLLVDGDRTLTAGELRGSVNAAALGGEIHVAANGPNAADIVGVATWFGPGQGYMATEEQRNAGFSQWLQSVPENLRNWWITHFIPTCEELTEQTIGAKTKLDSWYLQLLAVAPDHQKKGIAKTLMEAGQELARAQKVPLVVETTTQVPFYEHLGYEVRGERKISGPQGECYMTQMIKEVA